MNEGKLHSFEHRSRKQAPLQWARSKTKVFVGVDMAKVPAPLWRIPQHKQRIPITLSLIAPHVFPKSP